ncbi:MAG: FprA family A-type flavoprotein [Myxococcales bacterium]|nr:FprA family A-type flavoprotein [Myxococcales bacterium]HRC55847.1 MBL fold metallo-hydrolase [Kofleriaceae bacterium]
MPTTPLFDRDGHRNLLLEDFSGTGMAIQANQHVIVDHGEGIILDPGGHKVYSRVLGATLGELGRAKLKYIFLSHQDPDIVAAINGWLMTTDADAYASNLWIRFIPHFGLDHLVQARLKPIPDEGMRLKLGTSELLLLPAHFLHSCGNFHVYDPVSKILYTGDLGASPDGAAEVTDLAAHIPRITWFHQRYMQSNRALRAWTKMARSLDVEIIAPQHGGLFRGVKMVHEFYDWCDQLQCGIDVMEDIYQVPGAAAT